MGNEYGTSRRKQRSLQPAIQPIPDIRNAKSQYQSNFQKNLMHHQEKRTASRLSHDRPATSQPDFDLNKPSHFRN